MGPPDMKHGWSAGRKGRMTIYRKGMQLQSSRMHYVSLLGGIGCSADDGMTQWQLRVDRRSGANVAVGPKSRYDAATTKPSAGAVSVGGNPMAGVGAGQPGMTPAGGLPNSAGQTAIVGGVTENIAGDDGMSSPGGMAIQAGGEMVGGQPIGGSNAAGAMGGTGGAVVVSPVGGEAGVAPAGGQPGVPPVGGEAVVPPVGGGQVVPPAGGEPGVPPVGGEAVVPPVGGEAVVPPVGGENGMPPAGGDGSGGRPMDDDNRAVYPNGPYGTAVGATIADLQFIHWDNYAYRLSDIRQRDGVQLIVLVTTAAWCPECMGKMAGLGRMGEAYEQRGVFIASALYQDTGFEAADAADALQLRRRYSPTLNSLADPNRL